MENVRDERNPAVWKKAERYETQGVEQRACAELEPLYCDFRVASIPFLSLFETYQDPLTWD